MTLPCSLGLDAPVIIDVGRALREAGYMLWDTLWALILGFSVSGAVRTFVPRRAVGRQMGDHRLASVVRASLFGMVSSSCSYAAAATARSLVLQGADFLAALVFLVASTNLVVELGIVLLVLIGWQFVAAEFVGGVIMIGLLVVLGSLFFRGRSLVTGSAEGCAAIADAPGRRPARLSGLAEAAGYALGDLRMLVREIALGFVIAGFLSALVPESFWADLFIHGHGVWTSIENALVGPFVALIAFVCSVGNVPLAAALWRGGISFGGVVAFIFGDLVTVPLLLIYRKQYGAWTALRMLAVLWLVMSCAGLVTEYLFRAVGWVPRAPRGLVIAASSLGWNWTTYLDLAALAWFGALLVLRRTASRAGRAPRVATDPVCGMQVAVTEAPATWNDGSRHFYFCSDRCRDRFVERRSPGLRREPLRRRLSRKGAIGHSSCEPTRSTHGKSR